MQLLLLAAVLVQLRSRSRRIKHVIHLILTGKPEELLGFDSEDLCDESYVGLVEFEILQSM